MSILKTNIAKVGVAFIIFIAKFDDMKQLAFLFVVFSLFACQPRVNHSKAFDGNYSQLHKTDWLIGNWLRISEKEILSETWQQLNDSTFCGRSFFIRNGDTLSSELISLEQRSGKLYYIPTVSNQNDGSAIVFTQTCLTDSTVIFENPAHDFPQKITYSSISKDSLSAEISAIVDGKLKSQTFRMGRESLLR